MRVRLLLAFMMAAVGVRDSRAFSIEAVSLFPPSPIQVGSAVSIGVRIETPTAGGALYAPTSVRREGRLVRVDIYPSSPGMLFIIGSLTETVSLGAFDVGNYRYEIEIHPDRPTGWGTRRVEGTFSVGVRLAATRAETTLELSWPESSVRHRLLRTRALGAASRWESVPDRAVLEQDTWYVRLPIGEEPWFYRLAEACGPENFPPTVTLSMSEGRTLVNRKSPVVAVAEAVDSDGGPSHVEFYADGFKLGEDFEAPFTLSWTNASPGVHTLAARVIDDCEAYGDSNAIQVYVFDGGNMVECARIHLAAFLRTSPSTLDVMAVEEVDWPDACLGCLRAFCAQVITPGQRIVFAGTGGPFEVHTDHSGSVVLCSGAGAVIGNCR